MDKSNQGRVTLKTIAQATGYSANTVSHALKGRGDIAPPTAALIRKKAEELGYINDMVASSLRSGFTRSIALILPNVANPFWAVLTKGINLALYKHDYTALIMDTNEKSELEYRAVQAAIARKVDGIIIVPNQLDRAAIRLMRQNNVPYVLLGRFFEDEEMNCVTWDDENGAYLAASHLLELGKERVLFVNGPQHLSSSVERLKGYRRALDAHNIPYRKELVRETHISAASDNAELIRILEQESSYDAIFAFSDFIAWEIMAISKTMSNQHALEVPIAGFDDIQSELRIPLPLTTIGADKQLVAQTTVKMLMELIHGRAPAEPQRMVLPTYLVQHGEQNDFFNYKGARESIWNGKIFSA